jgi:signal transduction histidine kinase
VKELIKESSKYILISFEDNGPGISDEIKDQVFEPFFTTKKSGEGAGGASYL